MRKISRNAVVALCALTISSGAFAGNKDRVGQSGAAEMLINPWGRSTGVFGLNGATVWGIEAMKTNIAGMANDSTLEVGLSHVTYLANTGIGINNLAVAQPIGSASVIGFNIMSMSFGDVINTDYNNPEGFGTFHPQLLNVQVGYSRQFSTHVCAGAGMTYVSEQISNVNALGLAFEAGIQYVSGKKDNFHLGVTLRNLGTNMRFTGSGFAVPGTQTQATPEYSVTLYSPSEKFSLPTYLNISVAYDFYLDQGGKEKKEAAATSKHKLTGMFGFTSNSFINDYLGLGAEYTFNKMFQLRAAYRYENGIGDVAKTTTMYTGFAAGASVMKKIGSEGPTLALDYSFRPTQRPANGMHVFSIRFIRAASAKSSDE